MKERRDGYNRRCRAARQGKQEMQGRSLIVRKTGGGGKPRLPIHPGV